VSDILIRDVPEATVAEIDRRAAKQGISRSEFLRRWLRTGIRPADAVSSADFRRLSQLAGDLADPEVMRSAWS
jgi:metal-responsive CopG/Arc/MetJ family transcriptional regulator